MSQLLHPMGTTGFSLGAKRSGREADHSPPSSAEVKNAWSYTLTSQYVLMAWCLVKHSDKFTFTFLKSKHLPDHFVYTWLTNCLLFQNP
jgi:hypothetical protein